MNKYTYIVGLLVMGLVVFVLGLIAAERKRAAHRRKRPHPAE